MLHDFINNNIFLKVCLSYAKIFNPLSANPTKSSNTLKQFVDNLLTICLSVFDHFVGLALERLRDLEHGHTIRPNMSTLKIFQTQFF